MDVRDVQENGNNTKHTHLFFPRRNDCWAGDNAKRTTVHLGQVGLSARGGNRIKNLTAVAASPSLTFTFFGTNDPCYTLEQSQIFLSGGRGGRSSPGSPVVGATTTAWLASSTEISRSPPVGMVMVMDLLEKK